MWGSKNRECVSRETLCGLSTLILRASHKRDYARLAALLTMRRYRLTESSVDGRSALRVPSARSLADAEVAEDHVEDVFDVDATGQPAEAMRHPSKPFGDQFFA